jgi:hypothetical protein
MNAKTMNAKTMNAKTMNANSMKLIQSMINRGEISNLGTRSLGTRRPSHATHQVIHTTPNTHDVIHIKTNRKCAVSSLMKSLGLNLSQSNHAEYHRQVKGFMNTFPTLFTENKKNQINKLINPSSECFRMYTDNKVWRAANPIIFVEWNRVQDNNTLNKLKKTPETYKPGRKLNKGKRVLPEHYKGKVVFLWHNEHWDIALPLT